jgi:hypothetical protein
MSSNSQGELVDDYNLGDFLGGVAILGVIALVWSSGVVLGDVAQFVALFVGIIALEVARYWVWGKVKARRQRKQT